MPLETRSYNNLELFAQEFWFNFGTSCSISGLMLSVDFQRRACVAGNGRHLSVWYAPHLRLLGILE